MGLGSELAVALVEQGHEVAGGEDGIDAELRAPGMRRLAIRADERPQTSLVSRKDRVVRRLADHDKIGLRLLLHQRPRAAAVDLLVGDERQKQRAAPSVAPRGQQPPRLDHGRDRPLGVAGAAAQRACRLAR